MGGKVARKRKSRPLDSRIGQRVRVALNSGTETFVGRLLVVETLDGSVALADAERERTTKKGAIVRTQEGFVIVRGFSISSIQVTDASSPIGWTGHRDSLSAPPAAAGSHAGGGRRGGAAGSAATTAVNYAELMRNAAKK
jgi:hypothetical protein